MHTQLIGALRQSTDRLTKLCQALVQIDSQNPPGDTTKLVDFIVAWLGKREDLAIRRIETRPSIVNLLVRLKGGQAGRRLVFNGHLDTFGVGDAAVWTVPPLGGTIRDGRIYGRGVSDMKAGLAAALLTIDLLWPLRKTLAGELVLALAGDEETGGTWGTKYLLENVPEASGDAMMCGDAGSPRVIRFGEKGQMWLEVRARGRAAHGAHVHLGANAIERLIDALTRLRGLANMECAVPPEIVAAVRAAACVSEPISGAGESDVLLRVTVNIGTIEGGRAVNIVPDEARAKVDVRFPPGTRTDDIERRARAAVANVAGVEVDVLGRCEPNWTDPDHEIVRLALKHGAAAIGEKVAANMRVGFSDARYYRMQGVPSVVYGPTPHNMGGSDENVTIADLEAVLYVHALSALDYLSASNAR